MSLGAIEKVQKRATKLVISLKKISYTDRLVYLGLPTLKYRRLRGDMIYRTDSTDYLTISGFTSLNGLICLHSVLDKADSQSVFKRT